MRVIQLIDSLQAGGAERMAVNIANALADQGVESFLCATREEGILKEALNKKVGYFFAKRQGRLGLKGILKLSKFVGKHNIQILHAHSTSYVTAVILKGIEPSLKIIWHDHYGNADLLHINSRTLVRNSSMMFSGILAVNDKLARWNTENSKCKNIKLLENFADIKPSLESTIELPGIVGKRVIHLANFRAQKNHELSIKAFDLTAKKFPDWSLLLVGKNFEDDYAKKIKTWVQQSDVPERIHLLDNRSDIPLILSNSSIGVLSSLSEGLPLALLEYGTFALPVVATKVGDVAKVIGDAGILVPSGNVAKTSEALRAMMESEQLRKELGFKLQNSVKRRYSKKAATIKLLNFYKELK